MEPGVLDMVCQQQQAAAAAMAAVDTSDDQAAAAGSGTGCNPEVAAEAPHFSVRDLLGGSLAEPAFWVSHWETAPVACRVQRAGPHSSIHSRKQPGTDSRQQGLHQSVAQLLMRQLTPAVVMDQLLPRARHCPILDSAVDDPVEVGACAGLLFVTLGVAVCHCTASNAGNTLSRLWCWHMHPPPNF